jgi:hypothetical protein
VEVVEADQPGLPGNLNLPKLFADLKQKCDPLREIRNRLLAHDDWKHRANPLPSVQVIQFKDSLGLVRQIMNAVEYHYTNATSSYQNQSRNGDGKALIDHLRDYAKRLDAESETA